MKIQKRWVGLVALLCALGLLVGSGFAALAPVLDAAKRGDIESLKAELRSGADVNAAQGDGFTALHWAAKLGNRGVAEVLIAAGADIKATTRIGSHMPLHVAAAAGQAEVAGALLQAGAPVAVPTNTGARSIHFAAASGDPETVRVLASHGADVNAVEPNWGQTPLMFAAATGRTAAVETLMEEGADPAITADRRRAGDRVHRRFRHDRIRRPRRSEEADG